MKTCSLDLFRASATLILMLVLVPGSGVHGDGQPQGRGAMGAAISSTGLPRPFEPQIGRQDVESPISAFTTRPQASPAEGGVESIEPVGHIGGVTTAVAVQGGYAYIGEGPGLVILDIADPANPGVTGRTSSVFTGIVREVRVSGNYAYVASQQGGLHVVDVSSPSEPTELGYYDTPGAAHGLAVSGDTVYVADGAEGLRIVDASDPTNPIELGYYDTPGEAFAVAVSGDTAYVADRGEGLRIVDASDPTNPVELGYCDTPGWAYDVEVSDDTAYVVMRYDRLRIVDISDPTQPVEAGSCCGDPDDYGYFENVTVSGTTAYVGSDCFKGSGFCGLRIVDASDPAHPTIVGSYPMATPSGVAVSGDTAYLAHYREGLRLVDISDPTNPVELGSYHGSLRDPSGVAVSGDTAYVVGGTVGSGGLWIVDANDPTNPVELGYYDAPGEGRDVAISGDTAYVAAGGLWIVDASDPMNPVGLGYYDTPGAALDVAVNGDTAYVADGDEGLRIVDASDPTNPVELGYYDTPGEARGVAVSGDTAYMADDDEGLRIVDISDPTNPIELGYYDTPGEAHGVAVSGDTAYVADWTEGLRIVDIRDPSSPIELGYYDTPVAASRVAVSGRTAYVAELDIGVRMVCVSDPSNPTELGLYDTPGYARDIDIVGDMIYVADARGGLIILRYSAQGPSITPVYPTRHTTPSVVMQGGTGYRHLRVTSGASSPIPDATISFSTGETSISDKNGYFTATISADGLGGIGTYEVSVESVSYGGETVSTCGDPSFTVQVTDWRYSHIWQCGSVRTGSGGVSMGGEAYLAGELNGGMALTLEESNPETTVEDCVTMAEEYSGEAGAGFGVGLPAIHGGLENVEGPDTHLIGELLLRTEAGVETEFADPYERAAREAQGLMLLAGIADTITGFPSQPLLARILAQVGVELPYDSATSAVGVHERADLGIDDLELRLLIGQKGAELTAIDLSILAAEGDLTVVAGHRYRDTLASEFYTLDLQSNTSDLAGEIGPVKNLIGKYVGEYMYVLQEEVFYDKHTGQVNRVELTVTSEGNDLEFPDIDQSRVTLHWTIQGDQVNQDVLNAATNLKGLIRSVVSSQPADIRVGNEPIISEVNGLLGNVGVAEYEIITEDGAQISLVPEIGLDVGLEIDLGAGLELKRGRELLHQKGVLLNGETYPTASYRADPDMSRPGKSWVQLSANAVGGLWDLVKDAFNWVWRYVEPGVGWVIGTVSKTSGGVIQGSAQVTAPPGTALYAASFEPGTPAIQQTDAVTVSSAGWVPASTGSVSSLGLSPAAATASGDGFVVGGIYQFQPYTLTMSPAATLVITYTDEAAAGVDESDLGMFGWDPDGNNWQPMAATADTGQNSFTATITRLGTFAVGYDGTSPSIIISAPEDGSTIVSALPMIRALVIDEGTGVDTDSVETRLDGEVVAGDHIVGTGQLTVLPTEPLSDGVHSVTVSAADVKGNRGSRSAVFTVDTIREVYLPLVLRN